MGGIRDVFINEAHLFAVFWGSNAWHFSSFCSLIEGSECGCLSHHATIVESLGPCSWVVYVNVCPERKWVGRLWGEAGAGNLPRSNKVNHGESGAGVFFFVCACVGLVASAYEEIC